MGDKLDPAMRTATIARIHALTGLDERYIDAANMRIDPSRFQNELLRGDGKNVGRYDGRYTGPEPDRNSANPSYDPSDTNASSAFVGAWNHYAYDVLNFKDERPYNVIDFSVNRNWKYQRGEDSNAPTVVADLRNALLQNPYLHVLSANGYFDLATSFYGTEYLLDHMGLNAAQRARLHYAYFPSGHEVYLNGVALVQFKSVMVKFYDEALKR